MSAFHYFSIFDSIVVQQQQAVCIETKNMRRTVLLKDLIMGKEDLFDFVCWLVSDNERELFFSKNCSIKFIHCQANNHQLKVHRQRESLVLLLFKFYNSLLGRLRQQFKVLFTSPTKRKKSNMD